MIHCKELNKDFESKEDLFKALREAKNDIIADKKARIYNCNPEDNKGAIPVKFLDTSKLKLQCKELAIDDDYYYIAVNTTRILDGHGDVSGNGSWNKTSKDQQGKVYLVFNHDLDPTKVIVRKEHIELMVAKIPFSMIGKSYDGVTEALIYKFSKDKIIHDLAKSWLESGDDIEASVRLQYVTILLSINSTSAENKEYKKNYDKYHSDIANKEDFESIDYFWQVTEQKNILESSLVLAGSNPATGMIINNSKTNEPPKDTQAKEPLKNTLTLEEFRENLKTIII